MNELFCSLKRGNILSLSLSINELSAMKNYPELRRHWKNTVGTSDV